MGNQKNNIFKYLNLRLFDGADGTLDSDIADVSESEEVVYGIVDNEVNENEGTEGTEAEDNKEEDSNKEERNFDEEFDNLIKGDYKKQYDDRVHKNIAGKVAQINKLKAQNDSYAPIIRELSMKYNIQDGNLDSILNAIQKDTKSYEDEAYEKNMSVDEVIHLKRIEAENREFKRQAMEAQNRALMTEQINKWVDDAHKFSEMNPAFDFQKETQNQQFVELLKAGIDVKTAYNVMHINEIVDSAGQVKERETIDRIKSRNSRPDELTKGLTSKVAVKNDVNSFTDEDFERVKQLAAQGKRIVF